MKSIPHRLSAAVDPIRLLFTISAMLGCTLGCSETVRSFQVSDEEDASIVISDEADGEEQTGQSEGDGPEQDAATAATLPDASRMSDSVPQPTGDGGDIPAEAGADAGTATDPDAAVGCQTAFDCDDGVECTVDECSADGSCRHVAEDTLCTASTDGACDETTGCQYPVCNADNCVAENCTTARCEGDQCVRESACDEGEVCCAGGCVPEGCNDGLDCTLDSCGATGCEHTASDVLCDDGNVCTSDACELETGCSYVPNDNPCDDGTFCNGPDSCVDGACTEHGGDPCPGQSQCDESLGVCRGCVSNADCSATQPGLWSACDFGSSICGEAGAQERQVTSYSCEAGNCVPMVEVETRECERDTDGATCGDSVVMTSACEYEGDCTRVGKRQVTRTDQVCADGECAEVETFESLLCSRNTEGNRCGSGVCARCGSSGECDVMPSDDVQCGTVECPEDTDCVDWADSISTARCAALGVCKDRSACAYEHAPAGTECGTCAACDGAGDCADTPPDDDACGIIECPTDTPCRNWQADLTANRCESLGICIDRSSCKYEDAPAGTPCGEGEQDVPELQCDGVGECRFPEVICGGEPCYEGGCCAQSSEKMQCLSHGDCPVDARVVCDSHSDCPEGRGCCAVWDYQGNLKTTCLEPAALRCNLDGEIRRSRWVCESDDDCRLPGQSCAGSSIEAFGLKHCVDDEIIFRPLGE